MLLDSATDYAIVTLGLDGHLTSWNAGAERILGWKATEAAGRPFHDLYTPEDQAAGVPAIECAKALAEGRARNERWHLRADGSRFYASGWLMAVRDPDDPQAVPRELLAIMRDRTSGQEAVEAMRESEQRYRYAVELSPQIPFTSDPRGNVLDFSSRWSVLTGMSHDQTLGWGWARAIIPIDRKSILRRWVHCLRTGEACDVEGRLLAADGGPRWFRTRVYPRRDFAGTILAWHGVLEDVNDRRQAWERTKTLLELGDRLRELRDPADIVLAASEAMGRALGAARVGYAAIGERGAVSVLWDWTDGRVGSLADTGLGATSPEDVLPLAALLRSSKSADVLAVRDVEDDPRAAASLPFYRGASVRSLMKVPVLVGGDPAAFMFVHDTTPRAWSIEEVTFARSAAERAWSALAQANAERSQLLLTQELNHRVKNTLSVVQAMALQTVRGSPDLATFGTAFQARLIALARAHDLLTQRDWQGAPVFDVVRASLATAGDVRIDLQGSSVGGEMLVPAQALSLAMALHELFTNAVKHGALSVPQGRVRVTLTIESSGAQRIEWVELGGPLLKGPPLRRGFGLRLLEKGLARQSGMTTALNFLPEGLRCSLWLPRMLGSGPIKSDLAL
ncbi:PAS domain S-box protein [Roseomonas sp. 18066]|uniref:PAS domain-containing sensor histidine kinase n=1 Tax=Roseomonas sp. 18066 TaxID=2681412 RepID=UPI0013584465|nr:PAS domain S-box protein [Roseomonas sp. 18066]